MSDKGQESGHVSGSVTDKKGFKKVEMAEVVKLEKKGDEVSGMFVSLVPSQKYDASHALHYEAGGKRLCVFINNAGKDLVESQKLKQGDLFILEHAGERSNVEGTRKYTTYELYVKR